MQDEVERLVAEGVAALKAGDRERARYLLQQAVAEKQTHEKAWLWLSGAVDDDADRIVALQNVLTINPGNEAARNGLRTLGVDPDAPDPEPVAQDPDTPTPDWLKTLEAGSLPILNPPRVPKRARQLASLLMTGRRPSTD